MSLIYLASGAVFGWCLALYQVRQRINAERDREQWAQEVERIADRHDFGRLRNDWIN